MEKNELMVTITYDRLEELLDTETRVDVLRDITIASGYCVDREQIAMVLGFKLPKPEEAEVLEIAGGES